MKGQALITLLFFTIVSVTIISTVAIVTLAQAKSTSVYALSIETYFYAESGAEDALVRLLRDPAYTGTNLSIDQALVTVQVSGTNPKVITSSANYFGIKRTVEVNVDYSNNILRVVSWKEM
ncbi:MAG: hypothetical protein HYV39_03140 [Candidatus Levybacteria bacterium]|nr:hypothetical protein [Candidatus Levybacteria bacterium]